MTHWEIAAMQREADQVRRDPSLSESERANRLGIIAAEIIARGGTAENIAPKAEKRSTRNSRAASTRKKS